ncbi:MAG: IS3 family transposase [Candidatus Methylomirabilales bacterium]
MGKRQRFTQEFKREALRLWKSSGRPAAAVARELGLRRNHLYKWATQVEAHGEAAFPGSGKRPTPEDEIARLRREVARLREERDILKKAARFLCQGVRMRYAFIRTAPAGHPVGRLCRVLGVSRSGYYAWRTRPASARSAANAQLLGAIRELHAQTKERYGAVKLWHALHAAGIRCGRHRVARLRRLHGITARRVRRFRTLVEHHQLPPPAPNRLPAVGPVAARDQVWAGDLTTIATRAGWLYLAVVLDQYSRRIVGWAMGAKPDRHLAVHALTMAVARRRPLPGLIHHTDQGPQYASQAYRQLLEQRGLTASMSRKGRCADNARVESFFSTLKNELVHDRDYRTREEAQAEVFEFIEIFYNRQRLHQSLGYRSPVTFEATPCP